MSTPTGGNNGGDSSTNLILGVDTKDGIKNVDQLEKSLVGVADTADLVGTKIGTATIRAVKRLDELKTGAVVTKNSFDELQRSIQAGIEAEKEIARIQQATANEASRLIAKLREMDETFGMSTLQLYEHRAAQLGVTEAAAPLIASLQAMTQAERERAIQQQRDIQIYREQAAAMEEQTRIQQARDVWLHEQRQKEYLDYVAFWEKTLATQAANDAKLLAEEEATARKRIEIQQARDVELHNMRQREQADYAKWWEQQLAIQQSTQEKQALLDIKYGEMSLKQRVATLNKLQAYQADSRISPETTLNTFGGAAIKDLANYDALVAKLAQVSHGSHAARGAVDELGISFNNNRARTELLVIAHEALQNRFTRIPGSLMVLAEYTNAASLAFTGMGAATLAIVGSLALFGYELVRGQNQTKAFNDAINRTNGYAGETRDSLEDLARSVGKVHGRYTEAYQAAAQLTASGKFTKEQIDQITASAVGLEHAFGVDIKTTIGEFETLIVRSMAQGASGLYQVTKAVEKLDEKYHFLTVTQMEQIIQLENEGKQREASALAIKLYGDETQRAAEKSVEYIGYIQRGWNAVIGVIHGVTQAMADIGKAETASQREKYWLQFVPRAKDGSLDLDESHTHDFNKIQAIREYVKAEKELSDINEKAAARAEKEQKAAEAKHILTYRAIEDVRLMKKEQNELKDALDKFHHDNDVLEDAHPGYKQENEQYLKDREAAIIKSRTKKEQAAKDDGRRQDLQSAIDHETELYNLAKQSSESQLRLLADQFKKGSLGQEEAYAQSKQAREEQLVALEKSEQAKLAILNKYHPKNDNDAARVRRQTQETVDAYNVAKAKIEDAQKLSDQQFGEEQIDKYVANINKLGDAEIKQLDAEIKKQKEKNLEAGRTKEQIDQVKKLEEDAAVAELEHQADAITLLLEKQAVWTATGITFVQVGDEARKIYQAELDKLQQIIAKRKEYAATLEHGAAIEAQVAAQKKADELWKQTNKRIADDLANAIVDGGGHGWKRLVHDMEVAFAKLILRPIIDPISGMVASFMSPGASQAAGVVNGGVGGGNSLIGAAQTASLAYKAMTGNILAGTGSMIAGAGNMLGMSSMSAFGAGMGGAGMSGAAAGTTMTASEIFGSAGMTAEAGAASAGASVAAAAPYAAALVASYYASKWISGDHRIGGFAGKLMDFAGPLGGLANRAFGHGSTELQSSGMRGTLSDAGLTGENYEKLHQDGGWFSSDRNWTDTSNIDAGTSLNLTQGFAQMKSVTNAFAVSLGVNSDALKNYSKQFDISLTNDASKNQQAITDFFTTLGDEMASTLVPGLSKFTKAGEGAAQTLERLSNEFQVTDQVAKMLGKSSGDVFGYGGYEQSAEMREKLINAAGGLNALSQQATSYADNFLTQAEKLAPVQKAVTDAMASLGLASITTREQFKAEIDRLISTRAIATDEGAKEFASLMALSDAFAQVTKSIDDTTKSVQQIADERKSLQEQLDELTMSSAQLLAKQRDALDASNRGLFDQVQAAKAAKEAQDAAKQSLTDTIDKMRSFSQSIKSFRDGLLVGSLTTLTPEEQYAQLKQQYNDTYAAAKGGDENAQSRFSDIANQFLEFSQKINGADSTYGNDYSKVLSDSSVLESWADQQVDTSKAQLEVLNQANLTLATISQGIQDLPAALSSVPLTPTLAGGAQINMPTLLDKLAEIAAHLAGLRKENAEQAALNAGATDIASKQNADAVVEGLKMVLTDTTWAASNAEEDILR